MGVGLLEIGVEMRRVLVFSMKGCYKIMSKHPFLVSMLCFIAFLYRSFPLLFSVLVAASPVLVCTAVLLGTLLSFGGQPNIPEIEREEKTSHDIVSLKSGLLCDSTSHIESEDNSYFVERYNDKISDVSPLLEERSREIHFGNGVFEEGAREFYGLDNEKNEEKRRDGDLMESQYSSIQRVDIEFDYGKSDRFFQEESGEQNNEKHEEKHTDGEVIQYSPIPRVDVEFDYEKSEPFIQREFYEHNNEKNEEKHSDGEVMESQYSPISRVDDSGNNEFGYERSDSFDSKRVNLDSLPGSPWKNEESFGISDSFYSRRANLDSLPGSPWKKEDSEKEEDEDEEDFDSGSDRAESSSPDASMADIIPMLDELHPLLDEDAPGPVTLSHDGSDAASESSGKSRESDNESDDGHEENHEELEVADDENEDEEETQDKSKSAITWTEEDQKNLIDLGSSELERNQRLESLIARRRALKKMRLMMTEKNLIDLESANLPFNLSPISTARNNPFDVANVDYDLGLPPIPGSAPSVLAPRRNPFDLPYDSSEEKPDLMEDGFGQEFVTSQAKGDPLFRRHESFIIRPSILRPYFVPERMASEGTSYSSFQRQSSELSDSKVSSVPETESLGSVEDLEDSNLIEEDIRDKSLLDEHISEEPELISKIEHSSEHGSQSSEEVESWEQLRTEENNPTEIQSKSETSDRRYISQSSSSSLSSVSERIFVDKEAEIQSSLEETSGHAEQNFISREASLDGSDFYITSTSVDQTSHVEPIYDSSPSAFTENIFSSSFTSDLQVESVDNSQDIETAIPTIEEILAPVDGQESMPREEVCKNEEISQDDEVVGSANSPQAPVFVVDQASIDSELSANEDIGYEEGTTEHAQKQISSLMFDADTHIIASQHAVDRTVESFSTSSDMPSLERQSMEDAAEKEEAINSERHDLHSSNAFEHVHIASRHVVDQTVESLSTSSDMPSLEKQSVEDASEKEEAILLELHDLHSSNTFEHAHIVSQYAVDQTVESLSTSSDMALLERQSVEDSAEKEEALLSELHDLHSSNTSGDLVTNDAHGEDSISQCEEELIYSDKSVDEQPSEDHHITEPPVILVESIDEASTVENSNMSEIHDLDSEIPPIINSPHSPDSISNLHEAGLSGLKNNIILDEMENENRIRVLENYVLPLEATTDFHHDEQYIVEEADGIEDIDEVLLSELDTVGDFSINENDFETQFNSSLEAYAEVHERKFPLHPENLSTYTFEDVDKNEKSCDSEVQESGMSINDQVEASHAEFAEEVHEMVPKVPIVEADNSILVGAKLESTQIGGTESLQEVILEAGTDSGMAVLEAQTVEDIESAFWQVFEKEFAKSNVLEQSNTEIVMAQPGTTSVRGDSGMPVLEAQTIEDIETAFWQVYEKEIEKSHVLEQPDAKILTAEPGTSVDEEVSTSILEDSGMPVVDAQTIEHIELAFKQTRENETEHSHVLELPNAELVTEEPRSFDSAAVFEVSSSVQEDSRMQVLEAQTVEHIELAFGQTREKEMEQSNVLELPNAGLEAEEPQSSDNAAVFEVSSSVQEDSRMSVLEEQTVEDIELAFRQISEKEVENSNVLEVPEGSRSSDNAPLLEVSSSVQEDSGMLVLAAQTIEDIELAFNQICEKEVENSNALELPEGSGSSDNAPVFEVSSSVPEDSGMTVLEAQTIEDIFKQISEKEMENSNVFELPNTELVTEESGNNPAAVEVSSSIEDLETEFSKIREKEIVKPTEQLNAELATEESGSSDDAEVAEAPSHVMQEEMQSSNLERTSTVYFDMDHEDVYEDEYMEESKDIGASSDSKDVDTDLALHMEESKDIGASSDSRDADTDLALHMEKSKDIGASSDSGDVDTDLTLHMESKDIGASSDSQDIDTNLALHLGESKDAGASSGSQDADRDLALHVEESKDIGAPLVSRDADTDMALHVGESKDREASLDSRDVVTDLALRVEESRDIGASSGSRDVATDLALHMEESKDIGVSSVSRDVDPDFALKEVSGGNLEIPLNSTSEGESAEGKI